MLVKVLDETKVCALATGTDREFYLSHGYEDLDVEQAYNGSWYVRGYAPQPTIDEQNEQIRQQREARYEVESDPLRLDYDEALARGEDTAEALKEQWLHSKDVIREELPYIVGE